MTQIIFAIFFIIALLNIQCKKQDSSVNKTQQEIEFCTLLNSPENYETNIVRTKAIILGLHNIIAYSQDCLKQESVIELDIDYTSRSLIMEKLKSERRNYKTNYLSNNIYAEVTMVGELQKNDRTTYLSNERIQKYKFSVIKIIEIRVLSDEILPPTDTSVNLTE